MLDHHRLHYLHETVCFGSVRAAAAGLDINPSVISRQIAQREKELGITLIERLSRGIRPTEAGELLLQRFRQWSADQDDTIAKLRELQGLKRGHIDIVLGEGFVSDLMSGPLGGFWQKHPQLTMSSTWREPTRSSTPSPRTDIISAWCSTRPPIRAFA